MAYACRMADELEVPADVLAYAQALAGRLALEDNWTPGETFAIDLTRASTRKITEYWVHGAGAAKIRWGVTGSMKRCIRHLRKHVVEPGGLCAEYHHMATGEWPTEHGKAGIPS
jgi:hypothetical protein